MPSHVTGGHGASLASLPPTARQRRIVLIVAVLLSAGLAAAVPFSDILLRASPGIVIAIHTAIFINDLITAALLFAQYAVTPFRALLALAAGYMFTALISIPYTLSFPGALAPQALLGGDLGATPWLYWFWHFGQIIAVLAYALLKSDKGAFYENDRDSTAAAIFWSLVVVVSLVCGLTWIAVAETRFLPAITVNPDGSLTGNGVRHLVIVGSVALGLATTALVTLWLRRRVILDYWLMLVIWTVIADVLLIAFLSQGRWLVGFYAGRVFSLLTSLLILLLLLAEITRLYTRLARANLALERERDSKMVSIRAATSSIVHEVRQPLTGIVAMSAAARRRLRGAIPEVGKVAQLLGEIENATFRANDVLENVRKLFQDADYKQESIDVNTLTLAALQILGEELSGHGIRIDTELGTKLPRVMGHRGQLQEVILNLVHNAIDAMDSVEARRRALKVRTRPDGEKAVVIEVEDSGQGIEPERMDSIFQAFVTTKSHGTGLGLAICSRIVERHGGQLTASSDGKSGALFQIALPVASAMTAAGRAERYASSDPRRRIRDVC